MTTNCKDPIEVCEKSTKFPETIVGRTMCFRVTANKEYRTSTGMFDLDKWVAAGEPVVYPHFEMFTSVKGRERDANQNFTTKVIQKDMTFEDVVKVITERHIVKAKSDAVDNRMCEAAFKLGMNIARANSNAVREVLAEDPPPAYAPQAGDVGAGVTPLSEEEPLLADDGFVDDDQLNQLLFDANEPDALMEAIHEPWFETALAKLRHRSHGAYLTIIKHVKSFMDSVRSVATKIPEAYDKSSFPGRVDDIYSYWYSEGTFLSKVKKQLSKIYSSISSRVNKVVDFFNSFSFPVKIYVGCGYYRPCRPI